MFEAINKLRWLLAAGEGVRDGHPISFLTPKGPVLVVGVFSLAIAVILFG